MQEQGNLSVNTENLMPIIKKWLYSDRDIFLRELVSNGCDAISKLNKIAGMGQAETVEKPEIYVTPNSADGTLTITDNGIGMTAEEVRKYINQVAFSGAADFIEKYEQNDNTSVSGIIGHFGLGFYSAFMVSDSVEIQTLSYQNGAEPVHWSSDGSTEYTIDEGTRSEHGSTVILHLNEDSKDFLTDLELSKTLQKYCAFLPYPVMLGEEKDGNVDYRQVNDTQPLWQKAPSECTDEDYKKFYQRVFYDYNEPLFWIHLNVEYPFRLKGILYFPRLTENPDSMKGQIKLYNNQVYVADNIEEVIPEFLTLLKGVIDCPDMPLNVSRSFLQNDGTVKKISTHITKKVADRLTGLFNNEREQYNAYWRDIGIFIKYGCMRDSAFCDRMKDCLIYEDADGGFCTLPEYLEQAKEKHENKVYYFTNEVQQAQYIRLFRDNDIKTLRMDGVIDQPFINFVESRNTGVKFARIDSDLSGATSQGEAMDGLCEEFKAMLEDSVKQVLCQDVSSQLPALLLLDENNRRMQDMSRYYGAIGIKDSFPLEYTLVLNSSSDLIKKLVLMPENDDKKLLMRQIYDLASLANVPLTPERMSEFLQRSTLLLTKVADK